MTAQIVIGLGFGDEGKGMLTDYLCRKADRPLVIRFSGGHQAGHTIVSPDGKRHVFSNFGAGSLAAAPTFWSRYCTFHPIGYANELSALELLGVRPKLYVDTMAAVTTPYDLLFNRASEKKLRHGSCGLGFGATVARQEGPYKLHVMDLLDDFVLKQRLQAIDTYYREKLSAQFDEQELRLWMDRFEEAVTVVRHDLSVVGERAFFRAHADQFSTLIFEGSQGILLDQEFGYFPHVTRAFTSSKNALCLLERIRTEITYAVGHNIAIQSEVHYVSRAYQTRHGNGPLSQENTTGLELAPTPYETNQTNRWQGSQRRALLDVDQLRYALSCDANYSSGIPRYLTISCLDQIEGKWKVVDDKQIYEIQNPTSLSKRLGGNWEAIYGNYGQTGQLQLDYEEVGHAEMA
ncbi:MAG: adenylosuccinate synthetase [Bacteroidota bacterium]